MIHPDDVRAVAFSPDGKSILTGCDDSLARLWDTATGKLLHAPLKHSGPVHAVAFHPDGKTFVTGSIDKTARLWDASTGQPIGQPMKHESRITAAAFSPDGQTMMTGSYDRSARLWDASTGTADRPASLASRLGLRRGVQPRRQDPVDRLHGRHGPAVGRGDRSSRSASR